MNATATTAAAASPSLLPCTLLIVFGGRRNGGGTEYAMRSDQGERKRESERSPLLPLIIGLQCSGDATMNDAAAIGISTGGKVLTKLFTYQQVHLPWEIYKVRAQM